MSEIAVKPEQLSKKINQLRTLQSILLQTPKTATEGKGGKGQTATEVLQLNTEYKSLLSKVNAMINATVSYLENASGSFQHTDKTIASQTQNTVKEV